MATLKRNMIELVKEVKEGEIVTEKYLTPVFIPLSVVYQAIDLTNELKNVSNKNERDLIDKLIDFLANDIYKGQFTKDDLINGLHAPDAIDTLSEQLFFIARGYQTDEAKKYLEKKN
ncbi:phage tail assembly chaperone G [Metabacillus bambusae]|uniref:Phage protein n=1 Tax=Metabacillus bambusae TaxID=2795218 RepID=A0ABS3N5V9_9BACI|nr:hypothetical protein [Metabacillus bambusae]MBO1513263.1 hypothetical protein [Metabacillus bambusae]